MTESTRLRRFRWLALRVGDNFHGVFLKTNNTEDNLLQI